MDKEDTAGRTASLVYGVVAYAAFLATILYAIGFVGNVVVPKSIDTGPETRIGQAILINLLLLALFAVQHSTMARPAFKAQWTKLVPRPIERSTFVLISSVLLAALFWQWRPIPAMVWHSDHVLVRTVLLALFFLGWTVMFYSSFLIDHFDLFGLRQVLLHFKGKQYSPRPFKTVSLYKWVRHPLMLGLLIAFWSTPTMTYGHLLFSVVTTAYIFVGIRLEERDLQRSLGSEYQRYRQQTPMILPVPWRPVQWKHGT